MSSAANIGGGERSGDFDGVGYEGVVEVSAERRLSRVTEHTASREASRRCTESDISSNVGSRRRSTEIGGGSANANLTGLAEVLTSEDATPPAETPACSFWDPNARSSRQDEVMQRTSGVFDERDARQRAGSLVTSQL